MSEPIRVLHVLGGLSLGGAESRIMDLYRSIDRNKVQFDFLVHQAGAGAPDAEAARIPEFYDDEVGRLGGNIYVLPKFRVFNYFRYKRAVRNFFFRYNRFAVVQGHMTSTAAIYLPEAKKRGIPIVAAHARSAGVDKGIKGVITRLLRKPLPELADYCFACSKEAGEAVFGEKWKTLPKAFVIPNAIDAQKFTFCQEMRSRIREEWKITDSFVIGHVGRFHYAKNHEFLLEIFAAIKNRCRNEKKEAVLMLLGEGSGMEEAKRRAAELGIEESVLFMGNRPDVWNYYQAMDYFIFPSRFEGLPGTVVEAQAAGLRCMISDRITHEVGLSDLVHFESIEKAPEDWAEYVMEHMEYERKDMYGDVKKAGFDIREQAAKMERFYMTGEIS